MCTFTHKQTTCTKYPDTKQLSAIKLSLSRLVQYENRLPNVNKHNIMAPKSSSSQCMRVEIDNARSLKEIELKSP